MKYLRRPYYYTFLLLRKIKIALHNIFEPHINISQESKPENFRMFLWQHLIKNLILNENEIYFNTKVKNKKSPMILSQVRVILILCNSTSLIEHKFKSTFLIKSLTNYLISMRDDKGLFKFNQSSWDLQDEGIASVWSTLALIKAFETTKDKKYLEIAVETINSMLKYLYTKETSLVHTTGDNFWCLNSASTFAYACSLILEHLYSEDIKEAMIDSINLCLDKIAEDGHYPYNQKRTGTYLLLYHPIVIITLDYCIKSKYLNNELRERIIRSNTIARDFLKKLIDKDNRIFEPEIKHYSQYIITNVTSLLALKGKIPINTENALFKNICNFWQENNLFLCKDKNNKLYNSDLYSVKDVLSIEVLYWMELYLS